MPENETNFDVIVSNPPYISLEDYNNLDKELLDYEPKSALTDQNDGYTFFKIISNKSAKLLKKNGKLFFEVGIHQSENVEKIMRQNGLTNIRKVKDYLGIDRVVWGELK